MSIGSAHRKCSALPLPALAALLMGVSECGAPIDEDQDGYGGDVDCDDQDGDVYPGAYDRVGDGIDGNCDGAIDLLFTVAGSGPIGSENGGYSGDGGPATEARLFKPNGVAIDLTGDVFVADRENHRIRRIDAGGIILTVAGSGPAGPGLGTFGGDGGPATAALLNTPSGLGFDLEGDLVIVDKDNQRIREVDRNGVIRTIAGDGRWSFAGDGGPAMAASLATPNRVAFDRQGNLFIADTLNHRVRKVDLEGVITTVAGSGLAGEDGDFSGDGGPATLAKLNMPGGVAVDAAGFVYIADTWNHRIRRVDHHGTITTVAGSGPIAPGSAALQYGAYGGDDGPATLARLNKTYDVGVDPEGFLYIADSRNNRVRRVDPEGVITTVAGSGPENSPGGLGGDGGPATGGDLYYLTGVGLSAAGDLYIADFANQRVRRVMP